jgi:hypothetical protein
MSEEEKKGLKCNTKWNAIRKAYADFVGKPYVIPVTLNSTMQLF